MTWPHSSSTRPLPQADNRYHTWGRHRQRSVLPSLQKITKLFHVIARGHSYKKSLCHFNKDVVIRNWRKEQKKLTDIYAEGDCIDKNRRRNIAEQDRQWKKKKKNQREKTLFLNLFLFLMKTSLSKCHSVFLHPCPVFFWWVCSPCS